jgi:hypothetical protein
VCVFSLFQFLFSEIQPKSAQPTQLAAHEVILLRVRLGISVAPKRCGFIWLVLLRERAQNYWPQSSFDPRPGSWGGDWLNYRLFCSRSNRQNWRTTKTLPEEQRQRQGVLAAGVRMAGICDFTTSLLRDQQNFHAEMQIHLVWVAWCLEFTAHCWKERLTGLHCRLRESYLLFIWCACSTALGAHFIDASFSSGL